jgi:hypothetical protein
VVGTTIFALFGALLGAFGGLARLSQEQRRSAAWLLIAASLLLGGGALGNVVCGMAFQLEARYDGSYRIIVSEGHSWQEEVPPENLRGELRVWLFGHKLYDAVGPRDEIITQYGQFGWQIPAVFTAVGAGMSLLIGQLVRRRTKR